MFVYGSMRQNDAVIPLDFTQNGARTYFCSITTLSEPDRTPSLGSPCFCKIFDFGFGI
jgi:hypothetical protein